MAWGIHNHCVSLWEISIIPQEHDPRRMGLEVEDLSEVKPNSIPAIVFMQQLAITRIINALAHVAPVQTSRTILFRLLPSVCPLGVCKEAMDDIGQAKVPKFLHAQGLW